MDTSHARRIAATTLGALALGAGGLMISGCGSSADSTTPPASSPEYTKTTEQVVTGDDGVAQTVTSKTGEVGDTVAESAAPVTYGEGDGPITVTPNQTFVIQLIAGNGEQWQMTPTGDAIVTMVDQEPGQGTSDMKSDRWTFRATGAGEATLNFTLYDKTGKRGKTVAFKVASAR